MKKSVEYDVTNTDAKLSLAKMYIYTYHYKKAETTLKKLLNLAKTPEKRSEVYFLLGNLRNKQGYRERAVQYLKKSLRLNNMNEQARMLLGNLD